MTHFYTILCRCYCSYCCCYCCLLLLSPATQWFTILALTRLLQIHNALFQMTGECAECVFVCVPFRRCMGAIEGVGSAGVVWWGFNLACLPELGYPRLARSDTKPSKMHCSPIMSLLLGESWIHATTMSSAAAAAPDSQSVKHLMLLCAQRGSNTEDEDFFRLAASNKFSEAATVGVLGTSLETEQRLLERDVKPRRWRWCHFDLCCVSSCCITVWLWLCSSDEKNRK